VSRQKTVTVELGPVDLAKLLALLKIHRDEHGPRGSLMELQRRLEEACDECERLNGRPPVWGGPYVQGEPE
jgi:hypothetical protein